MPFEQFLCRQRRPEIGIVLADQMGDIRAQPGLDLVVRRATTQPVPNRCRTILAKPFDHPPDMRRADCQHGRRRCATHAAIDNTRRNLDPPKLALAHHDPSHVHPPRRRDGDTGRVTL